MKCVVRFPPFLLLFIAEQDELSYGAAKKSLEYFYAMNFDIKIQTLFISILLSKKRKQQQKKT